MREFKEEKKEPRQASDLHIIHICDPSAYIHNNNRSDDQISSKQSEATKQVFAEELGSLISMSVHSTEERVSEILAEHFGFAPISLVDEVINAVNDIMYKCTAAVETYLVERQQQRPFPKTHGLNEIKMGIAKMETLMENQVDRNFDKFELYTLRNILMIPPELVKSGNLLLEHQEDIDFNLPLTQDEVIKQCLQLIEDISAQLCARKILRSTLRKSQKLVESLRLVKSTIESIANGDHAHSINQDNHTDALLAIAPIEETLHYVLSQTYELITETQIIREKVRHVGDGSEVSPDEEYLRQRTKEIIERIKIIPRKNSEAGIAPSKAVASDKNEDGLADEFTAKIIASDTANNIEALHVIGQEAMTL